MVNQVSSEEDLYLPEDVTQRWTVLLADVEISRNLEVQENVIAKLQVSPKHPVLLLLFNPHVIAGCV